MALMMRPYNETVPRAISTRIASSPLLSDPARGIAIIAQKGRSVLGPDWFALAVFRSLLILHRSPERPRGGCPIGIKRLCLQALTNLGITCSPPFTNQDYPRSSWKARKTGTWSKTMALTAKMIRTSTPSRPLMLNLMVCRLTQSRPLRNRSGPTLGHSPQRAMA
jgi:hypothetical protein